METEKQINELLKEFGLFYKWGELNELACWYKEHNCHQLSEYFFYACRFVKDFIEIVRSECKVLDDIEECLDDMIVSSGHDYAFYKAEGLVHFAELAMIKDQVLKSIAADIERNK